MARVWSAIATAGLTMAMLAGCGREPSQAPVPQPIVLQMEPAGEIPERAELRLYDLGREVEVQIAGENFRHAGTYYATWGPEPVAPFWPIGVFPSPITVGPDGTASFVGVLSIFDQVRRKDRIQVLYDADGDPGERYEGTVVVLTAPLPESLFP